MRQRNQPPPRYGGEYEQRTARVPVASRHGGGPESPIGRPDDERHPSGAQRSGFGASAGRGQVQQGLGGQAGDPGGGERHVAIPRFGSAWTDARGARDPRSPAPVRLGYDRRADQGPQEPASTLERSFDRSFNRASDRNRRRPVGSPDDPRSSSDHSTPRFRQAGSGPGRAADEGAEAYGGTPAMGYPGTGRVGIGAQGWPASQPHRRGPKGYVRSDERVREDICERLMADERLDSSDVTVVVEGGIVRLEGTVPVRFMKHAIEDLVERCFGVRDIDNRVRVPHPYGVTPAGRAPGAAVSADEARSGSDADAVRGARSGTAGGSGAVRETVLDRPAPEPAQREGAGGAPPTPPATPAAPSPASDA